jgi:signal transduction histidine kinase
MRASLAAMYDARVIVRKRKPPLMLFMVAVLLVLLPLLAYFQYQWQGQVSEGLRGQMQSQMRRTAALFSEDFDREIRRVYNAFQAVEIAGAKPEDRDQQLRTQYAALYRQWYQSAPYAKLVSDVYLIPRIDTAPELVERLNPASGKFEEAAWPAELTALRKPNVLIRVGHGVEKVIQFSSKTIDRRIPALIVSISDSRPLSRDISEPFDLPVPVPVAQVIVRLNLDFIQQEFLPALARQHVPNQDASTSYNVTVIDPAQPDRAIYSTSPAGKLNTKGDVTNDLFSAAAIEFPGGMTAPTIAFASRDVVGRAGVYTGKSVFSFRTKEAVAGPFLAALPGAERPWQVVLTHQAGSLEAAVSRARERNLAINFGILLLLALSVAFILLAVQRERRLMRQQLEFVSAVSHELRTPLAVICAAGENLADGVVGNADQTRQYGALVRSEGRRLAEMVEQVLDFAGIQSGQQTYRLEPVEISDVVARALDMFDMQIRETGITLERRVPMNLPVVMADRAALVRAAQNLIGNALKYGASGKWLAVRAEATDNGVKIDVEDRGAGISPIDLPHIFEPFYRGRSVVDAQIQGSGLGLALVKQIVEAHNAKISVASDSSRTLFTITFATQANAAHPARSHDQAYSSR